MMSENVSSTDCAGWVQVKAIMALGSDFVNLIVLFKQIL